MEGVMVTVLMAVRDTPSSMLREAIASIRGQTLADFEFLILDDGSQRADTRAELEQQAAGDARIRLVRDGARGLTPTLNRGLALARYGLIARQDADDWSEPERLERQAAFLHATPEVGLCGTNAWGHRYDGRALWATRLPEKAAGIREALWRGNPFTHGSTMFRTDAARAVGGYREAFPCSQDYDFFWRLSDASAGANLPEPLYHYRYGAETVSARRAGDQALAHRATQLLGEARRRGETEDVRHALGQAAIEMQSGGAPLQAALKQIDHRMLAGDFRAAGRAYAGVLAEHPASGLAWGKLFRWAVFSGVPPARGWCFRLGTRRGCCL
jgi:glycosyltransferase involved in cell wall biosynthesis